MHENPGEDWMHPGCFSCPLKSSYEDFTNPPLEAADLFLALVPETLDFLDGSGLFWRCVCVCYEPPNFGHLQDLSFFPQRRLKASVGGGFSYKKSPRAESGSTKKRSTWFCWRWRWKGFTARMSMVLLCDNLYNYFQFHTVSLYWKMPVHTQLRASKVTKDEYVQYI